MAEAERDCNPQVYTTASIICSTPTRILRAVWTCVTANTNSLRLSTGSGVSNIHFQGTAGANHLVLENYLSAGTLSIEVIESGRLEVTIE